MWIFGSGWTSIDYPDTIFAENRFYYIDIKGHVDNPEQVANMTMDEMRHIAHALVNPQKEGDNKYAKIP